MSGPKKDEIIRSVRSFKWETPADLQDNQVEEIKALRVSRLVSDGYIIQGEPTWRRIDGIDRSRGILIIRAFFVGKNMAKKHGGEPLESLYSFP